MTTSKNHKLWILIHAVIIMHKMMNNWLIERFNAETDGSRFVQKKKTLLNLELKRQIMYSITAQLYPGSFFCSFLGGLQCIHPRQKHDFQNFERDEDEIRPIHLFTTLFRQGRHTLSLTANRIGTLKLNYNKNSFNQGGGWKETQFLVYTGRFSEFAYPWRQKQRGGGPRLWGASSEGRCSLEQKRCGG